MTSRQLGDHTFTVREKTSGWAVVRDDGFLMGVGFPTEKKAQDWLDRELALAEQEKGEAS
ncbi:hypothetical protein TK90_2624 (plasmid) [Thioalkalivibrio sp. K90mix]|uniref:hypothetical protein n=1 Tax=Thioalkalivibrio sp. (strain K90mix) TaxID=396595 RepID=UPI000195AB2A|nr:hypothetical protein [Thioalkalivibrio sp. K90mix]ADC73111.1 hypothetical protein TK90_2624 [Thioalkalivibrio sp. K90mix]